MVGDLKQQILGAPVTVKREQRTAGLSARRMVRLVRRPHSLFVRTQS